MKYECSVCGYIYDEEIEGTKFEDLPDDWVCPLCGVGKDMFKKIEEQKRFIGKTENLFNLQEVQQNISIYEKSTKYIKNCKVKNWYGDTIGN